MLVEAFCQFLEHIYQVVTKRNAHMLFFLISHFTHDKITNTSNKTSWKHPQQITELTYNAGIWQTISIRMPEELFNVLAKKYKWFEGIRPFLELLGSTLYKDSFLLYSLIFWQFLTWFITNYQMFLMYLNYFFEWRTYEIIKCILRWTIHST